MAIGQTQGNTPCDATRIAGSCNKRPRESAAHNGTAQHIPAAAHMPGHGCGNKRLGQNGTAYSARIVRDMFLNT